MGQTSPSSKPATPSAAPGTSSGTRASARTPTCSPSATRSGPGTARRPSPTGTRSCSTSRTRPPKTKIDDHIRFHHRVISADWSTAESQWNVTAERTDTGETVELTAGFVFACSGYYRYDHGYQPEFAGMDQFTGPDHPPPGLARRPRCDRQAGRRHRQRGHRGDPGPFAGQGRRPRDHAAALTHLHRVACPPASPLSGLLRRVLPEKRAGADHPMDPCPRHPGLLPSEPAPTQDGQATAAQGRPEAAAQRATTSPPTSPPATTRGTSASAPCPTATCSRPSADGTASVVTDQIDTFTETGIRLASGAELEADIIVTATGTGAALPRRRRLCGGRRRRSTCPSRLMYKGMMIEGRAQPGRRHRVHQRLVDAEVRSHLRLRVPAAQPHARQPACSQCAAAELRTPARPRRTDARA